MFTAATQKFPKLKGRAGEVKGLIKPLLRMWEKNMTEANQQHRLARLLLQASAEMEDLLEANSRNYALPSEDSARFKHLCFQYVLCSSALSNYYHARGIFLFHFTIKHHYLLHLGLLSADVNPRITWCFSGEDLMAKVKALAQSSCRGVCPQKLVSKMMTKYMYAVSFTLTDPERLMK